MPHSFTQIHIHYVFSPKFQFPVLSGDKRDHILNYIAGICKNYDCHLLCGFLMPDHAHLLIHISATHSVAEIAKVIKANTSRWLNTQPDRKSRFEWQEGYGAFSCSYSQLEGVKEYIQNQEEHHKGQSFEDEYRALLLKHHIDVSSCRTDDGV